MVKKSESQKAFKQLRSEAAKRFTPSPLEGNDMNRGLDEWRNSFLHDNGYTSNPPDIYTSKKHAATRIIRGVGGVTSDRLRVGVSFADTAPYRKFGFTLAEVLKKFPSPRGKVRMGVRTPSCSSNAHFVRKELLSPPWREKRAAFTLAEVLITLGIIGVVAAMTMPVLINNIKYHSYDNAKRKVLNSVGEAGKLLAIEGDLNGVADAEDFVKNRLAKKMSIAKFCDSAHLTDCGLPSKFLKTNGKTEMNMPTKMKGGTAATVFNYGTTETQTYANKNSYGFVTGNGYSVNLFYNGACITDKSTAAMITHSDNAYKYYHIQDQMCFFAIYDMNGKGGPNVVGKDIGLV